MIKVVLISNAKFALKLKKKVSKKTESESNNRLVKAFDKRIMSGEM
jgi:hypothetical protein